MNAPIETADRLVAALRDLLSREAVAARSGSASRVRAIQARISPLVVALSKMLSQLSPDLKEDVAELVEARRQNTLLMKEALLQIRSNIKATSEALGRVRKVGPAYRRGTAVASRLYAST